MEYHGGGHAILRALFELEQDVTYPGFATIQQICDRGQPHCNVAIKNDHWRGNGPVSLSDHGHGWESNKTMQMGCPNALPMRLSGRALASMMQALVITKNSVQNLCTSAVAPADSNEAEKTSVCALPLWHESPGENARPWLKKQFHVSPV